MGEKEDFRQGSAEECEIGVRVRNVGEQAPTEPWATVIGVVGATRSIRYNHLRWDRYPAVYGAMFRQKVTSGRTRFDSEMIHIYVRGDQGIDTRLIASAVHQVDPDLPVGEVRSTGAILRELRAQPRLRSRLLAAFAVFTLALAGIGIYGAMTQLVEQRRREIGIRMALGAAGTNILGMVLRRSLLVAGAGIASGLLAAAWCAAFSTTFPLSIRSSSAR